MPSPITISPAHTATQVCRRTVSSVAQQAPSRSELRRAITSFDQSPLVSASLSVSHSPYRPAACSVEALKPEGAFEIERKPSSSSLEGAFELPRVPGSLVEFDRTIELDPHQKILGKGASPFTTLIDLKKELSSFG
ncbi:uncharacterized protein [Arachis hypogaea]|uniref:uncharacterized protein isoform X2 n=1 Tax=Arachis hypogaea TaxID=3818 RepID=UPI003B213BB3